MAAGILRIIAGLTILIVGGGLGIAWISLCFSTVVIGVILLVFSPTVLFLPLFSSVTVGILTIKEGWRGLSGWD